MKKIISCVVLCGFIVGCLLVAGCSSPTKVGGGGKQQPYNPRNGQYESK